MGFLLAEGLPWWITANSDNHFDIGDTVRVGNPSLEHYRRHGSRGEPVETGVVQHGYVDFAPGFYSRTCVGSTTRDYRSVMAALRSGRVFVVHGGLVRAVEGRVAHRSRSRGDVRGAHERGPRRRRGGRTARRPRHGGQRQRRGAAVGALGRHRRHGHRPGRRRRPRPVRGARHPGRRELRGARARHRPQVFRTVLRGVADPLYVRFRGSDGRHADADGTPASTASATPTRGTTCGATRTRCSSTWSDAGRSVGAAGSRPARAARPAPAPRPAPRSPPTWRPRRGRSTSSTGAHRAPAPRRAHQRCEDHRLREIAVIRPAPVASSARTTGPRRSPHRTARRPKRAA